MSNLTVVINAHNEDLLIQPSLQSAHRAVVHARTAGYDVDVVLVLDRPSRLTRAVIEAWQAETFKVVEVDHGDLGLSRNSGVAAAAGEFIAFLDGDDLFGETWLKIGLDTAYSDKRPIIWHPEISVYFGARQEVMIHTDMESDGFEPLSLAAANLWTALCLTRRDILLRVPYPSTDLVKKIGFEDWGWHRHCIEADIIHKVVKGTGHAIRVKPSSLGRTANAMGAIPSPTHLFRQFLLNRSTKGPMPAD